MSFEVVDLPSDSQVYHSLLDALKSNVGRAIKVTIGEKTANAYRQSIRALMLRKGDNKNWTLGSKELSPTELLLWLTAKEAE